MRKRWLWGLGITLLVGLSVATSRAGASDEDDPPPSKIHYARGPGLFERWFGSSNKPEEKKPAKKDTAKADKDKPEKPVAENPVAVRAREEAALMRRIQVCDRLKNLANQINDDELYRRAEELDQKAWAVYQQRTSHLPVSNATRESDEDVLDRHLGNKAGAAANSGREVTTETAKTKDRDSQAAVREVKP
jgi:hypothetical protein